MSQEIQSSTFPSEADRKALHLRLTETGWKSLSEPEQWHWHAYIYAFRRVFMGDNSIVSPPDHRGEWFAPNLVESAEKMFRARMTKRSVPPSVVRENFEDFRVFRVAELSQAELDLLRRKRSEEAEAAGFAGDLEGIMAHANRKLRVKARSDKAAFRAPKRGPDYMPPDPDKAYQRASLTPERVAELEARLERVIETGA